MAVVCVTFSDKTFMHLEYNQRQRRTANHVCNIPEGREVLRFELFGIGDKIFHQREVSTPNLDRKRPFQALEVLFHELEKNGIGPTNNAERVFMIR